jgi:acyl-CoA synthetase (AMP-forming)/AMP-acid ligase II
MIKHITEAVKLSEIVQFHAAHKGDRTAYIYLLDGEEQEVPITFSELDLRARAFAAALQKVASPGERALLLYPSSLEFIISFLGCLYAGIVAVPTTVPHLKRGTPRLRAMVEDAQATIACTDADLFSKIQAVFVEYPAFKQLHWIVNEQVDNSLADEWQDPQTTAEDLCFLQYTSGSTSAPKGVMISNGNLMSTIRDLQLGSMMDEDCAFVSWLPIFHDLGLILGLLTPLYVGSKSVFMSPVSFLEKPVRWLKSITKYKSKLTVAPNFAYDLCVQKVAEEETATLNLGTLQGAGNAAEPVRLETLLAFKEKFGSCGFKSEAVSPSYGLAEATVMVSATVPGEGISYCTLEPEAFKKNMLVFLPDGDPNGHVSVGCGRSHIGADIRIVNPQTCIPCAPDEVGEIWLQSTSVAQGYWGKPEATEATFKAHLADTGEGPFLRTGDMGFIHKGHLHVSGRMKDMVIVQGRNFYPQDIELTVEKAHEGLRPSCGAAFAIDDGEREQVIIVQEVKREFRKNTDDFEKMANAIRMSVAKYHGLRVQAVALIMPSTIHKTTSGKIQRNACRESFLNRQLEFLYEWHAPGTFMLSKDEE